MPSESTGTDRGAQPAQADPRAAVEEDHDERDDADPLDGPDRELAERRERRPRAAPRRAGTAPGPGSADRSLSRLETTASAKRRRDEEHDDAEVVHLVHSGDC